MKPGTIPANSFGDTTDQVIMGGRPEENRLRPAGPVDPDLTFLSIQYANGLPLAVLANYGIHYGINEPGSVSADYFGQFCRKLKSKLISNSKSDAPFMAIMSNGASGDIANLGGDIHDLDVFTDDLVNEVSQAYQTVSYKSHIKIGIKEVGLSLAVDKPDSNRIKWAENVLTNSTQVSDHKWTRIFAQEALFLNDFPDSFNVKLQVFAIDDIGIAGIPGEVFAETGILIKKNSPFKGTFVISHANDWHGYLPPPKQHLYGGMEVWRRRASYLEVNATTKIRNQITGMFSDLYLNQ